MKSPDGVLIKFREKSKVPFLYGPSPNYKDHFWHHDSAGNAKPGGYRPRSEIDGFEIDKEDFEQTKFIFKLAENQGPTPHDFVDAIGRLKFRGTSNLLRLPTIIMEFVSPEKAGFN